MLDSRKGLHQVVEVCRSRITNFLALPESKCVYEPLRVSWELLRKMIEQIMLTGA